MTFDLKLLTMTKHAQTRAAKKFRNFSDTASMFSRITPQHQKIENGGFEINPLTDCLLLSPQCDLDYKTCTSNDQYFRHNRYVLVSGNWVFYKDIAGTYFWHSCSIFQHKISLCAVVQ